MGFWYQNAQLGPYIPCNGPAAPRQPVFDTGDNTINNSATPSTPFNLTPATGDYTCKNVVGGQTLGELSWNATTKKLKVKGTIFIDGSATVDSAGLLGQPGLRVRRPGDDRPVRHVRRQEREDLRRRQEQRERCNVAGGRMGPERRSVHHRRGR